MRTLRSVAVVIAAALSIGAASAKTPASSAPDVAALMKPIEAFVAAFNTGQAQLPAGVFDPDAVTVDGFAPYLWQGPNAISVWYAALVGASPVDQQTFRDIGYHLEISAPLTVRIDDHAGYIVVPASNSWSTGGAKHFERAHWAMTFDCGSGTCLITSHSWTIVDEG